MAITYIQKPGYVVNFALTGNQDFALIWVPSLNVVNFQIQWSGLTVGNTFQIMGTNQDIPVYGANSQITYPPPLTPIVLATATLASASGAADLEAVTGMTMVFLRYTGAGGGTVSVAFSGKSYG